jgi:hypothetical protein
VKPEPKLEDYPYDPNAVMHELRGLDRLRAVEYPPLREAMFRTLARLAEEAKPKTVDFTPKAVPQHNPDVPDYDERFP